MKKSSPCPPMTYIHPSISAREYAPKEARCLHYVDQFAGREDDDDDDDASSSLLKTGGRSNFLDEMVKWIAELF